MEEIRQEKSNTYPNTTEEDTITAVLEETEEENHRRITGENITITPNKHNGSSSCINMIGPRHPTLISSDINATKILPYQQSIQAHMTKQEETPRTHRKVLESLKKRIGYQ
ncbi:hypothetical protein O181_034986 [Austropuccinia psidii MF-1]|uniref:Uncharacterized protein n=1 Tax=Austropuccinia psidii MF-1 TaxID=1389203 RepID=A0A9Q3D1T5_9BASI|nr:hypothetical protein [Austropuccinia psidii MF-1]